MHLFEGLGQENFDVCLFAVPCERKFTDQQITGALQHFLLAERKAFGFPQNQQTFQDGRNLKQRSGPHAIGVFFESVFPVRSAFAIPIRQVVENFLDLAIPDHAPQAHRSHAVEWDRDLQVAGFDIEEIVLLNLLAESATADLLNNSYAVIRVNHPIPDVEMTVTIAAHK